MGGGRLWVRRRAVVARAAGAVIAAGTMASWAAAQTATWIAPGGGTWLDGANWSTAPAYPNSPTVDVLIPASGGARTIGINSGYTGTVNLRAMTIADPNAIVSHLGTLNLNYGTLDVLSGTFRVAGGTLANGTVTGPGQLVFDGTFGEGFPQLGPILDRVTISNMNVVQGQAGAFTIRNGLTLDNTTFTAAIVNFPGFIADGTQSISGTGTFLIPSPGFAMSGPAFESRNGSLTIGAGITFKSHVQSGNFSISGGQTAGAGTNFGTISVAGQYSGLRVSNFTNHGTVNWAGPTGAARLHGIDNRGTITVANGNVFLEGEWRNTGTFNATNVTLVNEGTFRLADFQAINRVGGTYILRGTLDNAGKTLVADSPALPVFSGITVKGGTVTGQGGTLALTSSGTISGFDGATLDANMTVTSGFAVANTVTIPAGRTVRLVGGGITMQGGVTSATLDGGGEIVSDHEPGESNAISVPAGVLTFGPSITVRGGTGWLDIGDSVGAPAGTGTFVNKGLISAKSGGGIRLAAKNWVNHGVIEGNATDGSGIILGGSVRTADLGTFNAVPVIVGEIDNTGMTLPFSHVNLAHDLKSGATGTIKGGTVTGPITVQPGWGMTASGILDGVTAAGPITVESQAELRVRGGLTMQGGTLTLVNKTTSSSDTPTRLTLEGAAVIGGAGTIALTGAVAAGLAPTVIAQDAGTLTISPGVMVHSLTAAGVLGKPGTVVINQGTVAASGGEYSLTFGGDAATNAGVIQTANGTVNLPNWTNMAGATIRSTTAASQMNLSGTGANAGTIEVTAGTVNLAGNWSSTGTILVSGGTLNLGGAFNTASLTTVRRTAGSVAITGTLDNTGNTFVLNAATLGTVTLGAGGTIRGGTVVRGTGDGLSLLGGSALDGVTLDGSFSVGPTATATTLAVTNGLTLANGGTLTLAAGAASGTAQFTGSQTLGGAGTLAFAGSSGLNGMTASGGTLTIGPGVTVTGTRGGTIAAAPGAVIDNRGTIWSQADGQTVSIGGAWSNTGLLKLTAGTLNLGGSFASTSLDDLVHAGGTLAISGAVDNAGRTLTIRGAARFTDGGSITGGTVTTSGPAAAITVAGRLPTDGGGGGDFAFNGVTLATDITIPGSITVTFTDSPVLANARILVPSSIQGTRLRFLGSQTLGGTGEIFLDGTSNNETVLASDGTLTLGTGITVRTGRATTGWANIGGDVVNLGTIIAGAAHPILAGSSSGGNFTNGGSIRVEDGGRFSFQGLTAANAGSVVVDPGGTLVVNSKAFTNSGTVSADGAHVTFGGAWTNTGTVSVRGGTLTVGGTTSQPGTFDAEGSAVTLAGPVLTAGTLHNSAVTIASTYTTAQISALSMTGPSSSVTIGAGGTLDNTSAIWTLGAARPAFRLAGGTATGGTIASADGTPLVAAPGISTLSALALDAPVTVADGATLTLNAVTNGGTVTVAAGGTLAVNSGHAGHVVAGPGSTVSLRTPVASLSAATIDGASVRLRSPDTSAAVRALNATSTAFTILAGGAVNNAGDDLRPSAPSNSWTLAGGVISGGTIEAPVTAIPIPFAHSTSTNTVAGVTMAAEFTIAAGAPVSATSSLTFAPGGSVRFAGDGTLTLASGAPLSGTGQVVFDGPGAAGAAFRSFGTLAIPAGLTVRTGLGSGTVGNPSTGLTNHGLISDETPGQSLTITGTNWTNAGTLRAAHNSTLYLAGSFSRVGLGTVATSDGGVAVITGTLSNFDTLTVRAGSAVGLGPGGTISGGTVASGDGTPLYVYAGGTQPAAISGATVSAPVTLLPGSSLWLATSTSKGAIVGTGAGLTLSGATNSGSITLSGGSTLTLNSGAPTGSIVLTDSTLAFNLPVSTSILTKFTRSNTVAQFAGTVTNANDTLVASDALGPVRLVGTATLADGRVTTSGNARLLIGGTNTLSGVTLQGGLTVQSGASLTLGPSGITPVGASASVAAGAAAASLLLNTTFAPAPTADAPTGTGVVDISFDGTSGLGVVSPQPGSSTTIGPAVTVRTGTQGGTLGRVGGSVTSTGTISARTPGKVLTVVGTFRNNNLVEATAGGTLRFNNGYTQAPTGLVSVHPGSALIMTTGVPSTGRTDLAGGDLIYDYATGSFLTILRGQLRSARTTAGNWSATVGLTSSAAAADPRQITAIGYADTATLLGLSGTQTATWHDRTVDATAVVATLTYYGDANLDGDVDADDYATIDRGLARGLTGWLNGDFDYDGVVTLADYALIDRTTVALSAPADAAALLALREAQFGPQYVAAVVSASVPEPSSTLTLITAISLLASRRRQSRHTS